MSVTYFSPPQLAKLLKTNLNQIHSYIASGELRAINLSRGIERPRWKVSPADFDAFLERRSNQRKEPARKRRAVPAIVKEYV